MAQTTIPYGDPIAVQLHSANLFKEVMQRKSILGRLVGKMPNDTKTSRLQTTQRMPIVRCTDLETKAGKEVLFDLLNPIQGKPIMGERFAEGHGERLSFSQDSIKIDQTRKPVSAGGRMTQQRTPHDLRDAAYTEAKDYFERLEDQMTLVHLAGARGFDRGTEWVIPTNDDPDFGEITINRVKAPSRNRHYVAAGDIIEPVSATGGEIKINTTDLMTIDTIDAIGAALDSMHLPPISVQFPGDEAAIDDPIRVLLVSPFQYASIKQSKDFRLFQAMAGNRGQLVKDKIYQPLFFGQVGLWNGILVVKMNKAIRFYPGDPIHWCAGRDGEETTTDTVPRDWNGYAVDRALLLGGQALMEAFGNYGDKHGRPTGSPCFWSEKLLDHDDKLEILAGMVGGKSKVRFNVDHGAGVEATDFGVIAIDTAVRLIG